MKIELTLKSPSTSMISGILSSAARTRGVYPLDESPFHVIIIIMMMMMMMMMMMTTMTTTTTMMMMMITA
jgi:hypothetical protein